MAEADEAKLVEEGALPPDDFHDAIERIGEIAKYQLEIPPGIVGLVQQELGDVLVDVSTIEAAAAAVLAGHLVIQGPPGTGKSTLARALCRAFNVTMLPVTAHQEWSTFEVIGRQELHVSAAGDEEIVPVNGFFTEAAIRCAGSIVQHFDEPGLPQATWLLIDELNRAHIDKAFGELFTILGTDETVPITLSHQADGNRQLVTPRRFRIVATLNSVDRQFVNNLGQGLKRRFSFVTVGIPPKRGDGLQWNGGEGAPAQREFQMVLRRAADRAARKTVDEDQVAAKTAELIAFLAGPAIEQLQQLFSLVEIVRYAKREENQPHVPIGSAQLIDCVELFLLRLLSGGLAPALVSPTIDWAASVKLAPLFDADNVTQSALEAFVGALGAPFTTAFRKELREILAAGQYFVE